MKKRPKLRLPRSHIALDAKSRHAGPMKHRNEPRGGAQNESRDLQEEARAETEHVKEQAEQVLYAAKCYEEGIITAGELACKVFCIYDVELPEGVQMLIGGTFVNASVDEETHD